MPEITYKEFESHLKKSDSLPAGERPQVYLFHGEELLYKKAFTAFIEHLLPPDERAAGCEPVDGAPENILDAVNRANTYALLPGNKIVAVQEARIFYGKQEQGRLLEKAKEAMGKDEKKKASKFLLSLLGQSRMKLDDLREPEDTAALLTDDADGSDARWILSLAAYCRDNGLSVPTGDRPDQFLENAVDKGFPRGNYLALTTDLVDKRKSLFKTIREKGLVVDCSVPKGTRKADRVIQEEVLKNRMNAILRSSKKSLTPPAFSRLYDLTGFDLRTFSNNIEKLVLYVGERPTITPEDVAAVLERSKQDPIYELTGAVTDRNPKAALSLLDSLLQSGLHHLQVFTAIVNQMRKLLLLKLFLKSSNGQLWQPGMPYNLFTARVLPAMTDYDQELADIFERWHETLTPSQPPAEQAKKTSRKKKSKSLKVSTDLLSAANPKNPYPIYLTLKKADKFTLDELTELYAHLGDTDIRLKRSGPDPRTVLEETILKICRRR